MLRRIAYSFKLRGWHLSNGEDFCGPIFSDFQNLKFLEFPPFFRILFLLIAGLFLFVNAVFYSLSVSSLRANNYTKRRNFITLNKNLTYSTCTEEIYRLLEILALKKDYFIPKKNLSALFARHKSVKSTFPLVTQSAELLKVCDLNEPSFVLPWSGAPTESAAVGASSAMRRPRVASAVPTGGPRACSGLAAGFLPVRCSPLHHDCSECRLIYSPYVRVVGVTSSAWAGLRSFR